jgi:phosphoribosylamine--glycine ligase
MDARNFLFVSVDGLISDIAWRVSREGHDVQFHIADEGERDIADGLVPKTDDWRSAVDWADVVVFDDIWETATDVGTGRLASELRASGTAVVGGTELTDRLEEDRGFAMSVLREAGVNTLPHREFTSFDEGIQHVRDNPAPYVVKPSGEVQNVKRLVYVGSDDDGGDVVDVLRAYQKAWGHRMKGFQLQRRVRGVEVALAAFFNGSEFVEPIAVNFEHKKLFPGNVGPSTGEMGTSMFWTDRNRLFEETLGRLEGLLAEEGYVGSIDINCIVNARGVYPLEFTPRFGYPTISLQEEGMKTPIGAFLYDLANGGGHDLTAHRGYQVGVRLCLPPFPFHGDRATFEENSKNAAITFQDPTRRDGLHIEDVKEVDGQWRVAGTSGVFLLVAGKGPTMAAAREEAYRRVENVVVPNMYYRDDIGERWIAGDGDRLQAWGYLRR